MAVASNNPHGRGHGTPDISEVIAKHIDCLICCDTYTNSNPAKALPCQHTFCLNCINQMVQKKYIQCPHCKVNHKLPKKGAEEFKTSYQLMSLVEDFENIKHEKERNLALPAAPPEAATQHETAMSENVAEESALCNVAINQIGKLHNEVQVIRNRVDNVYNKAAQEVTESCSKIKNEVTLRLREIERSIHKKADDKAAVEMARICSHQERATRGVKDVAGQCERKLQSLQTTRRLRENDYEEFNEQLRNWKAIVYNISQNYHPLPYKTMSLPLQPGAASIDHCYQLDKFQEMEKVLTVNYGLDNTAPSSPISPSPKPRQDLSNHPRNPQRNSRKRQEDRERVIIKSHSADDPNYNPNEPLIILSDGDSTQTVETDRQPQAEQTRGGHPPDLPPLPPKASANQGHLPFNNVEVDSSHTPADTGNIQRDIGVNRHQQDSSNLPPLPPKVSGNQSPLSSNVVSVDDDPERTVADNNEVDQIQTNIGGFNFRARDAAGTKTPPPPLPIRKLYPNLD